MYGQFTKGMIIPIDGGGGPVVFEFNPYEVHINKIVKWHPQYAAGREMPYWHHGCGESRVVSFSMELSRDNNSNSFVKSFIDSVLALTKPTVKGAGLDRPPKCQAILGASLTLTCIVHDVKVRFGSHHGQRMHYSYLADPGSLLPSEGHLITHLLEYK
jgi:hypothetical protein